MVPAHSAPGMPTAMPTAPARAPGGSMAALCIIDVIISHCIMIA